MRTQTLTIVLSAGVVAGLAVYALLEFASALQLLAGSVVVPISWFVATLAGVGFASAAVALLLRGRCAKDEADLLRRFEARLAELETERRASVG